MNPSDPYTAARKAVARSIKPAAKRGKEGKANVARAHATSGTDMPSRVRRIVDLEQQVAKKSLTDDERNSLGASLLREKLAAVEELRLARRSEASAQANATGRGLNRPILDARSAMIATRDGTYTREAPPRGQTELSSQTRASETAARIAGLEKQLRKSSDPLERDRVAQDLTFERLRAAHRAGRI